MATVLLVVLGGVAALVRVRQRASAYRVVASCALAWLLLVGTGILPGFVLARLQTHPRLLEPAWADQNVIVVLGAGIAPWPGSGRPAVSLYGIPRVTEAARLYRACQAAGRGCRVVTSGGDPRHAGTTESAVMTELLVALGVPSDHITREARSNNTFQNAQFSAPLLGEGQVILVSSSAHLTRALLYFAHFGIVAVPAPSDMLSASSPWQPAVNFMVMDLALHELVGIARLHVYNALGLNDPPARR